MTQQEFDNKYKNINIDDLTDEEFIKFKNDCFEMYEHYGFLDKYQSPYDELEDRIGMGFKVLRRATTDECDLEALPLWLLSLKMGKLHIVIPKK